MSAKHIKLQLDHGQRQMLIHAIQLYCDAAYPPGGSECGQAAREALLNTVQHLLHAQESGLVVLSRRLRPNLRAAIRYYCEQQGLAETHTGLIDLLK